MEPTHPQLAAAANRLARARQRRDRLIAAAADGGMSRREIARVVGLSHQRVHQIIEAERASRN